MHRKLIGLSFAATFAVSACSSQWVGGGSEGSPLTVTRLRAEPFSYTYSSGLVQPARLVIRDEATWRTTWNQIWSRGSVPALPTIDFSKEMVIVAALGEKPSGGYGILVDSAWTSGNSVVVRVKTISPGPKCGATAALTQPVDIARMPLVAGGIGFVDEATVTNCP